uniref:Uncharacterized protein n=1 Tax=Anopheles culicifacies TaxID=139723 RepID=A0A182MQQ8_9DIPT
MKNTNADTNQGGTVGSSGQSQPSTSSNKPTTSKKAAQLSSSLRSSLTMVAGSSTNFHAEFRNDPVVKEMRQIREENARRQKHDYSHVFRFVLHLGLPRVSNHS